VKWVKILYSNPKAAVITNGITSSFFNLSRSTRQGCPLSPLLFTLVLEPLASMIRDETRIGGVFAGDREHKLLLYADDIMLVVKDPACSLQILLNLIESYSKFSGYKINWHKSEAMPVSAVCFASSVSAFKFKWMHKGIKYLGIHLSPNLENIMNLNMDPLLHKIQAKLDGWKKILLTLWGKINIIKMVIAPQFNYISGMVPLTMPPQIYKRYNAMIKNFLWEGKRPRIGFNKLCLPRDRGGLALPNVELYKTAFEMSKIAKHWGEDNLDLDWVLIERQLTSPFRPIEAFSQNPEGDFQHHMTNPILLHSKEVWKIAHKKCKISHMSQYYSSIWNNPYVKVGKKPLFWGQWFRSGIRTLKDLFSNDTFLSYNSLKENFNLEGRDHFWKYLQIRNCLVAKVSTGQDKNVLEKFCELPRPLQKSSKFYHLSLRIGDKNCENLRLIWQRDINSDIDKDTWNRILSNSGRYIREARGKFIQYKVLHRYYYTPVRLFRMGCLSDNRCWKCKQEIGTYMHVLWHCSKIQPFWKIVLKYLGECLGFNLPFSSRICLLGDKSEIPQVKYIEFSLVTVGVITAVRLILRFWKDIQCPSFKMWIESMVENVSYERMLAKVNGKHRDVNMWENFIQLVTLKDDYRLEL